MADVEVLALDLARQTYEEIGARLWRAIRGYSGSADIADEAVAEAFAQLVRRGSAVFEPRAWIWRTAFAIARGELKDRELRNHIPVELRSEPHVEQWPHELDALMALRERDREVLVLRYIAGYSAEEIGRVQGLTAGAVRVRLHRATQRARRLLKEDFE
jgi:RNA polymerase sigma-70 factor (ECF subfamily)